MKRKLSMLLCAVMVLGTLVGCGGEKTKETETQILETEVQSADVNASKIDDVIAENGGLEERAQLSLVQTENASITGTTGTRMDGVSYVMIYNPLIYSEDDGNGFEERKAQSTGDMSSQIMVGMNKSGGLDPDIEIPTVKSQAENDANVDTTGVNRDGIRAGAFDPSYNVNDQHDFYHSDLTMTNTLMSTFTCVYSGSNCYIWALNGSMTADQAQQMGAEFDANIYNQIIAEFGPARFTENGGKINLLFYPMQEGLGGYFTMADIFSSAECPADYSAQYGFNVDHAIIHINSDYVITNPDYAKSTMAHELQHLICASDCFNYAETPWMETWLNEAMSAHAEELIYPGTKEAGYYNQFMYLSHNFRTGQSLYNFDTTFDEYIGAYGAVYLFGQYLKQFSGPDVFTKVHDYWRYSYRADVTAADAVSMALSDEAFETICDKYTYSPRIYNELLTNAFELTLSKITLDFYIETLKPDLSNLYGMEDQMRGAMLYTEVSPVEIEGGGRILVATQNGSYQIPADADPCLVYIGLDANFNVVSMFSVE